jgi:hypothetical protein
MSITPFGRSATSPAQGRASDEALSEKAARAQIEEFGQLASLPDGHAEQQFTCQQRIGVRASILLSIGFRRENAAISVLSVNAALNGGPS